MTVIIIEDEKPAARRLDRMLKAIDVNVDTMLHSVEESLAWFQNNEHPDLIFLDIQLSDGLSFEIFEAIDIKSAVIFTTAYDEYALQAFKLNSIDYLLKPIDDADLLKAVEKFRSRSAVSNKLLTIDFNEIKNLLVNPIERTFKQRFTVKVGQHLRIINVEDIECFYSENKGTYAYTNDGRTHLLDLTLDDLEKELDSAVFFRTGRKYVISIHAIKDMVSYTNSRLQIKLNRYPEQDIIVARERVNDFKDWLE